MAKGKKGGTATISKADRDATPESVREYMEMLEGIVLTDEISKDDDDDDSMDVLDDDEVDDDDDDDTDDDDDDDDDDFDDEDDDTEDDDDDDDDDEDEKPSSKQKGNTKVNKSARAALSKADPAIRSIIEKMDNDNEELRKRVSKAEKQVTRETALRERAEWIAKAEQMTNVPVATEDLAGLLQQISKGDPQAAEAAEKLFGSMSKQLDNADLFTEIGKSTTETSNETLSGRIAEIIKNDNSMTPEQAYVKAMEENPALYDSENV